MGKNLRRIKQKKRANKQVEDHIDLEMERLGRRSSEDGDDDEKPIFPGLVPDGGQGSQMVAVPSLGGSRSKAKATWTKTCEVKCCPFFQS